MEMTNTIDEVLNAMQYIEKFDSSTEYKENCAIVWTYINDLVNLVKQSQDLAKKAAEYYLQAIGLTNNREGRRRLRKAGFTLMPDDNKKTE